MGLGVWQRKQADLEAKTFALHDGHVQSPGRGSCIMAATMGKRQREALHCDEGEPGPGRAVGAHQRTRLLKAYSDRLVTGTYR